MISEGGACSNHFINDSISNITHRNNIKRPVNALNQLLSENKAQYQYDPNGNLISMNDLRLSYDALDRLIEVKTPSKTITYSYDAWNRRISKSTGEQYLYIGQNEIGMYSDGIKELRLLGLGNGAEIGSSLSIELSDNVYVPIHDLSGSIVLLLDMQGEPISQQQYSAYGEALLGDWILPWGFASKRLDAETYFLNFGQRYYCPSMCKWITPDPAGFVDSINLYQYALNNSFRYCDPTGENLLGFFLGMGEILAGGAIMTSGVALEIATFGGYTFALGFHETAGLGLVMSGCATAMFHAQDITLEKRSSRPDPDIRAEGRPHTIIQVPGPHGSYTTHNGDGTYKQYRGSGKPHGNFPRPNIKETKNNPSPSTQP